MALQLWSLGPDYNISTIGWIALKSNTDMHGVQPVYQIWSFGGSLVTLSHLEQPCD